MFLKKKEKVPKVSYDPEKVYPAMRCSICTGEKVAGLKSREGGAFEELMLIRGEEDLKAFRESLHLPEETRIEEFY